MIPISYPKAFKTVLYFSLGTLPVRAIKNLVLFAESIMLSRINNDVRAATTLINLFFEFSFILPESVLAFASTSFGTLNNEDERGEIGSVAHAAYLLSLMCSLPQVLFLAMNKEILEDFNQKEELILLVNDFLKVFILSVPITNLQLISEELSLSTEHIYAPAIGQVFTAASQLTSAYMLIYGEWGAPKLGISGAAWSFLIGAVVNSLFFGSYFWNSIKNKGDFYYYNLLEWREKEVYCKFKELFLSGMPLFFSLGSELGALYSISILSGLLGKDELSCQLVVTEYQNLLMISTLSLGSAAQIAIANALHTEKKNILRYGNAGIMIASVPPIIYTICSLAIPQSLVYPFFDSQLLENKNLFKLLDEDKLLVLGGLQSSLLTIKIVSEYALSGADLIDWRMVLNSLVMWLGVLSGYLLAFPGNYGKLGLNLGFMGGLLASTVGQGLYWNYRARSFILESEKTEQQEERAPLLFSKQKEQVSAFQQATQDSEDRDFERVIIKSNKSSSVAF